MHAEVTKSGGGAARAEGAGRVSPGRLLWAGPLAGVGAAAANAAVYLAASALGAMPEDVVVPGRGPITLGVVVASSFVPALLAAVAFAVVGRLARRPTRGFFALTAVVFALSVAAPFLLAGAPAAMIAALLAMHVVAAVVIAGVLAMLAHKP